MFGNDLPFFRTQGKSRTNSAALSHSNRGHEPESDFSRRYRTWTGFARFEDFASQSPAHAAASYRALGGKSLDRSLRRERAICAHRRSCARIAKTSSPRIRSEVDWIRGIV